MDWTLQRGMQSRACAPFVKPSVNWRRRDAHGHPDRRVQAKYRLRVPWRRPILYCLFSTSLVTMSSTTAQSDLTTSVDGSETADRARRFGGIARLYGAPALAAFEGAHVAVIGIGGVGSWVAEALARSAVGTLTLIDLDNVAESNTNRQIHALDGNFDKPKVEAMA